MSDARYLYVEHLTDAICPTCGELAVPGSVSHGFSMSHVADGDGEPLVAPDPLPATLRLSAICPRGHEVIMTFPGDVRCMTYKARPDAKSRTVTRRE